MPCWRDSYCRQTYNAMTNNPEIPPRLRVIELFAWIGEDELGSGVIGLKQAECPLGRIPMVATIEAKISQPYIEDQLGVQADHFGKKIYLCRFRFDTALLATDGGAAPV